MAGPLYDRIGLTYATTRRADPRLERAIHNALGDAESVINVGAGAGGYTPRDREVVAVEPSPVIIAQRPEGAATVVQAQAERLPFEDDSFDVAMAVLSDHHWEDRQRGLSVFSQLEASHVAHGIAALEADLDSGASEARHRNLLALDELALGYHVVVAELAD